MNVVGPIHFRIERSQPGKIDFAPRGQWHRRRNRAKGIHRQAVVVVITEGIGHAELRRGEQAILNEHLASGSQVERRCVVVIHDDRVDVRSVDAAVEVYRRPFQSWLKPHYRHRS